MDVELEVCVIWTACLSGMQKPLSIEARQFSLFLVHLMEHIFGTHSRTMLSNTHQDPVSKGPHCWSKQVPALGTQKYLAIRSL